MKVNKLLIFPIFLIFFVSTTLILIWFRQGLLYGGGDVGLPSYDPPRTLEKAIHIWWEASAPGTIVPHGLTSVPFQVFQTLLYKLGLSPIAIQATVLWILLSTMGIGMYWLALTVFGRKPLLITLAVLFYMFNPYMMVQVWHRFIHNTFFLAAVLPFLYIFWKKWIQTGSLLQLFLYALTNLLGVYLFGAIAFIATTFILLIFTTIVEVLFPWQGRRYLKIVCIRSVLAIIVWFFINAWWLIPVFTIVPATLSQQHSNVENLSTLLAISRQAIIPHIILGINSFYLYDKAEWGTIYNNYFFRFLPWLSLVLLIPGFIKSLSTKRWLFWSLLFILGLFLAKGAASPFGYIYILGFSKVFALGALRNPFEKLGILLPFASAILLTIGAEWYLSTFKRYLKLLISVGFILLTLLIGVNLWPMWLGKVFGTLDKPGFVIVPKSYSEADNFIKNQNKSGKILHLPLSSSESVIYNWEFEYSGIEPSQLLFKSLPSISHGFNINPTDDALNALSYIFLVPDAGDKILPLLQSFNIRFIILHKDINWHGGYLSETQSLENKLDQLNFLERKRIFGDLRLYELKNEFFNPRLKLTTNVQFFIPSQSIIYWPWLLSSNNVDLLSPLYNKKDDLIFKYGNKLIVFSEVYKYSPKLIVREKILGEMPAARFLPDSAIYPLIRLKEKVQYFILPVNEKFLFKFLLAGKRLTESYLLKEKNSSKSITPQLNEYLYLLSKLKDGIQVRGVVDQGSRAEYIEFVLFRHLATLDLIKEKTNNQETKFVDDVINQLKGLMSEANISPQYQLVKNSELLSSDRLISRFNLPFKGKYELLQAKEEIQNIYPDSLKINYFQINNEVKSLTPTPLRNFISFGTLDLQEGLNEISFNSIPSTNLSKINKENLKGDIKISNEEIDITSEQHGPSSLDLQVEPIHGGNWYQINLDYWVKLGDKFTIQVIQDSDRDDPTKPGEKKPSYNNEFLKDVYINYWNSRYLNFYVYPATTKVTVRLLVNPWNGCKFADVPKSICVDKLASSVYEQKTQVLFKNVKVIRFFTNPLFLRRAGVEPIQASSSGNLSFNQSNASSYTGSFSTTSPTFLIFNESYHSGWSLELSNGDRFVLPQRFISNNYGNAWYIEKPGNYNFKLTFSPERKTIIGLIISVICLIILTILVIKERIRR